MNYQVVYSWGDTDIFHGVVDKRKMFRQISKKCKRATKFETQVCFSETSLLDSSFYQPGRVKEIHIVPNH